MNDVGPKSRWERYQNHLYVSHAMSLNIRKKGDLLSLVSHALSWTMEWWVKFSCLGPP